MAAHRARIVSSSRIARARAPISSAVAVVASSVAYPSVLTATTIAVGAAVTLVLGVLPGPVLDLAAVAGEFIR